MSENELSYNPNSEKDALDILRLGIIQLCGLYPDIHKEYFELKTIGLSESRELERKLSSMPGVAGALKITHPSRHRHDAIFKINKQLYLDSYRADKVHASFIFMDGHRKGRRFDAVGHWNRLEELDQVTKRQWAQTHSPVYSTEVVQLIPAVEEPAPREVQVREMAHQLIGDEPRAKGETEEWLEYMRHTDKENLDVARTAVPASWASRQNIVEMSNRVQFKPEERDRLRKVLALSRD